MLTQRAVVRASSHIASTTRPSRATEPCTKPHKVSAAGVEPAGVRRARGLVRSALAARASPMGTAIRYLLNHKLALCRFLDDGVAPSTTGSSSASTSGPL
jgi:hypothetical protein